MDLNDAPRIPTSMFDEMQYMLSGGSGTILHLRGHVNLICIRLSSTVVIVQHAS